MEFESPERCTAATFTRDGAAVAAAYEDGSLRLFDLDAIAIKWTVTHHAAPIIGLAVDRAGTAVLAASRDGTLTVTEVAIGALQSHTRDLVGHAARRAARGLCGVAGRRHVNRGGVERRLCCARGAVAARAGARAGAVRGAGCRRGHAGVVLITVNLNAREF